MVNDINSCSYVEEDNNTEKQINQWKIVFNNIKNNFEKTYPSEMSDKQRARWENLANCIKTKLVMQNGEIESLNSKIMVGETIRNEWKNSFNDANNNLKNKISLNRHGKELMKLKNKNRMKINTEIVFNVLGLLSMSFFIYKNLV